MKKRTIALAGAAAFLFAGIGLAMHPYAKDAPQASVTSQHDFMEDRIFDEAFHCTKDRKESMLATQSILKAAKEEQVSPSLLAALVEMESGFLSTTIDEDGNAGFMQISQKTADAMQMDRNNPEENIRIGARMLRHYMYDFPIEDQKKLEESAVIAYLYGEDAMKDYQENQEINEEMASVIEKYRAIQNRLNR